VWHASTLSRLGRTCPLLFSLTLATCGRDDGLTVVSLEHPAPPAARHPHLSVGARGAVSLSWLEPRPARGYALKVAVADTGTWSRGRTVALLEDTGATDGGAAVRAGPCGMYLAHWNDGPAPDDAPLRTAISIDGAWTWTLSSVLVDGPAAASGAALSTYDSFDGVGLVWIRREGDRGTLHDAVLAGDGATLHPAVLDSAVCHCCGVAAVRAGRGAVVAYHRHREGDLAAGQALVLRRAVGRAWSDPVVVDSNAALPACAGAATALARHGDTVAVVWRRASGELLIAWSFDGGVHVAAPAAVADGAIGDAPVVAVTARGAVVGWTGREGLQARRVRPDGSLGSVVRVAARPAGSPVPSWIPLDDGLLVAWEAESGTGGALALQYVGDRARRTGAGGPM
jgi:hypothetical protein